MIYEMRTDTFATGANAKDFVSKFGEAIEHRNTFSRLGALWITEIGPLNQVIHIWPYESLQHRIDVRSAVAQGGVWPPKGIQGLLGEDVEVLNPASFMRPWGEVQELGNVYEVRTYMCKPGSIREMIKRWGESVPHREKYSAMAACWYTEFATQFKWVHVWPYADLDERARIRAEATKDPHWPPPTGEFILSMESKIVVPAPFSTMR